MRRAAPALIALATLALTGARPASSDAPPSPPQAPASGFGGRAVPFPEVREETFANPLLPTKRVHVFRPTGASVPRRLPVACFAHGFGALDAGPYEAWLRHVAGQGVLVVYPTYPAIEATERVTRYDVMWAGFEEALRLQSASGGPAPDLARMGFLGHSFGGGAVPALAARAAARGWGSKALWLECLAPYYDFDRESWAHVPPHAVLLVVAFEDDVVVDPAIAASFVASAASIPADRKALLCFHADEHGTPPLHADHLAPLTVRTEDAFDRLGTWRLDDALRAFAIEGSENGRARSLGAEATDMGAWSDGTPVAPLTRGVPARSRLWLWAGGPAETLARRLLAREAHSSLPLPPPALAPASRLPAAERLARAPPSGRVAWPDAVEGALARGPVLIVLSGKGSPAARAVLDAVAAAGERLKAAGIEVVALPEDADGGLSSRLGVAGDVAVLLVRRDGTIALWREAPDPHLVDAAIDLAR